MYYKHANRDTYIYQEALNNSCKQLKRFFKNNQYLLGLHGMSIRQQVLDMNSKGLSISWHTISNLKQGRNKTAALVYINLFAVYWGYNGAELLFRDISKALPNYVNLPLCSYSVKGSIT